MKTTIQIWSRVHNHKGIGKEKDFNKALKHLRKTLNVHVVDKRFITLDHDRFQIAYATLQRITGYDLINLLSRDEQMDIVSELDSRNVPAYKITVTYEAEHSENE